MTEYTPLLLALGILLYGFVRDFARFLRDIKKVNKDLEEIESDLACIAGELKHLNKQANDDQRKVLTEAKLDKYATKAFEAGTSDPLYPTATKKTSLEDYPVEYLL